MKQFIVLALLSSFVLTSCNMFQKEEKQEVQKNEKKESKEKTSPISNQEENREEEISSKENLETNQTEKPMRKLQNGDVVAIITTNKGKIEVFLDTKNAPITTANFIGLAKKGYYNGIIFHRIIKGFMIQGGDPTGTGMGGESIYGNKFVDEFSPELRNNKFTISMANAGSDTNGSQFFINVADNNALDNRHSVFGEVVNGEKNVLNISKVKTDASDKPESEIKMISVEIKKYDNGKYIDYDFSEENAKEEYKKYLENLDLIREEAEKQRIEAKKNLVIEIGNIVTLDITLKNEEGTPLTSTRNQLQVVEKAEMMSGLNEELKGMKIGEKKTLTLTPELGFGEYREDLKKEVPKAHLLQFTQRVEEGLETPIGKISKVDGDTVILDTNNPFAGKTIIIDFEVKDID